MTHRQWSYLKSTTRIVGFIVLILAEVLGIFEEEKG